MSTDPSCRALRTASLSLSLSLAALAALPGLAAAQGVQQVNVTATRFSEAQDALPFGVSVLTSEQLRASGVSSVNEALMKLAGIPGRQDSFGGADYALDLRGFGTTADNNQVIVVDGVRISEADISGTRLSGINIDTIERIEVIRGSAAVLYGEGATGGVISITTKAGAGVERQNNADVYAAAGRYDLRDVRASATLANAQGLSLDVAANKRETDNHRANFRARSDGYALTGQWAGNGTRVGVRAAQDSLDSRLPGSLTAAQYAADPHQTAHPNDHGDIRNTRYGLFANTTLAGWQVVLDVGWRDKRVVSATSFAPSVIPNDYDYDIAANGEALRAKRELTWGGLRHAIAFGVDLDSWKRLVSTFGSHAEQRSEAVYLKDDITFAGGTRLAAGVRSERVSKNDSSGASLSGHQRPWELGLTQPLGRGWSVYGRIGSSFRYAAADEYNSTPFNASLVPQTSRDSELGARWSTRANRIDLRLYRSALSNEIGYDPTAPNLFGPGANVNFAATRHQGVELETRHGITSTINVGVNAALRRAEFVDGPHDGKQLPLTPQHSASVYADWRFLPQHRVDASVRHVGPQHPDFANQCAMPSYTTGDVRYAYQLGTLELALAVANVADKRYYTQAFECIGGVTNGIYPEAGRAAVASLRWSFF